MVKSHNIDSCFLDLDYPKTISAVVCCKNREKNLKIVLDSWLCLKEINEIIVLDFGCDHILKLPQSNSDKRIKIYRYESKIWHLSKAYNIAIQLSQCDTILKLDCDYYLYKNFFDLNHLKHNEFIVGATRISTRGLLWIHRKDFLSVNGYNERIINWGGDDTDLYYRLTKAGVREKPVINDTIKHIPHPESLRTKYVPDPSLNRHQTNKSNILYGKQEPWTHKEKMSSYYD
jgi:glycosyltransferase involved in cell wall biosynthesis